jgi:hypothetical protein
MTGPGQARKEAGKALDVILQMLPDPALRAEFAADPLGYLSHHGVTVADLADPVRQLLAHPIDGKELDALNNASVHLQNADLVENKPNDPAGFATLCKF